MNKYIEFKFGKDKILFEYLHPIFQQIIFDQSLWCEDNDIPFKITETVTNFKIDKALKRVSDSHRTRRAIDLSIKKFPEPQREIFKKIFNERYKSIASVSSTDGVPRLIVEHGEGDNRHFHIAISKKFSLKEFDENEYNTIIREIKRSITPGQTRK